MPHLDARVWFKCSHCGFPGARLPASALRFLSKLLFSPNLLQASGDFFFFNFLFFFCTIRSLQDLFKSLNFLFCLFSTISPGEQVEWTFLKRETEGKLRVIIFPQEFSSLDCDTVIYERLSMPFLQLEGFLYILFPPWGAKNVKNHKELPNLSRLCLFPKVERDYPKDPVFGYLNEVFGQKWPFLTRAY